MGLGECFNYNESQWKEKGTFQRRLWLKNVKNKTNIIEKNSNNTILSN